MPICCAHTPLFVTFARYVLRFLCWLLTGSVDITGLLVVTFTFTGCRLVTLHAFTVGSFTVCLPLPVVWLHVVPIWFYRVFFTCCVVPCYVCVTVLRSTVRYRCIYRIYMRGLRFAFCRLRLFTFGLRSVLVCLRSRAHVHRLRLRLLPFYVCYTVRLRSAVLRLRSTVTLLFYFVVYVHLPFIRLFTRCPTFVLFWFRLRFFFCLRCTLRLRSVVLICHFQLPSLRLDFVTTLPLRHYVVRCGCSARPLRRGLRSITRSVCVLLHFNALHLRCVVARYVTPVVVLLFVTLVTFTLCRLRCGYARTLPVAVHGFTLRLRFAVLPTLLRCYLDCAVTVVVLHFTGYATFYVDTTLHAFGVTLTFWLLVDSVVTLRLVPVYALRCCVRLRLLRVTLRCHSYRSGCLRLRVHFAHYHRVYGRFVLLIPTRLVYTLRYPRYFYAPL